MIERVVPGSNAFGDASCGADVLTVQHRIEVEHIRRHATHGHASGGALTHGAEIRHHRSSGGSVGSERCGRGLAGEKGGLPAQLRERSTGGVSLTVGQHWDVQLAVVTVMMVEVEMMGCR